MYTIKEIAELKEKAFEIAKQNTDSGIVCQNDLIINLLTDIRELLQKKQSRRILVEEAEMSEKEREVLNRLDEQHE